MKVPGNIEEMARVLDDCPFIGAPIGFDKHDGSIKIAEYLYHDGYHKQKEGEWISNGLGGYAYAFYCSECGWIDGYPFNDRHKYCPNCGAKMKGGAE